MANLPLYYSSAHVHECLNEAGESDSPPSYGELVSLPGEVEKAERHTKIMRVRYRGRDAFLKVYRYSRLRGLRTLGRTDKGEREFQTLDQCHRLGLSVPQPLAHGVRRSFDGFVTNSFLLTEAFPDSISLRDWLRAQTGEAAQTAGFHRLVSDLGQQLRILHENGFYFVRPSAKDIVVRYDSSRGRFDFRLLDMPNTWRIGADWLTAIGQSRDIGALMGTILRRTEAGVVDAFLAGYLPDPLGGSEEELRALIPDAAREHNGFSTFRHQKIAARHVVRKLKTRFARGRHGPADTRPL